MKNLKVCYQRLLLKNYKKLAEYPHLINRSYSVFFQKLKYAVFVTDVKGRFVFFNPAAEKLTGYSKEDVLKHHFRLLFTLDDLNDGFLFFYQTMQGCYSEHSRFRIRCKDGATKVIDVLASPIVFNSKTLAALTIARDVTGKSSDSKSDEERVRVFKKFSEDLESWDQKNKLVKLKLKRITQKLSDRTTLGNSSD